jgi:osmotically-inducible protein OsmY
MEYPLQNIGFTLEAKVLARSWHEGRSLSVRSGSGRTTPPPHRGEVSMTDLELKKAVEAELNFEPSIDAAAIGVAEKDGIVTLTGHMDSYWAKIAAERAASRVAGVRAVANDLDVRLPTSSERTDEDMARAVINALNWSVLVPADRIKVTVSKGWVTLEGHVDWEYQKRAAERAVRDLVGVRGVSKSDRGKTPSATNRRKGRHRSGPQAQRRIGCQPYRDAQRESA